MDFKNAFLNGGLEEVCMDIPPGIETEEDTIRVGRLKNLFVVFNSLPVLGLIGLPKL